MNGQILSHPDRVKPKLRPLKALHHFRKLIADKEDTEQVFHIFESLPSKGFFDRARDFVQSENGKSLLKSENYLPTLLDDHDRLRTFPLNSVAHAYVDFMEREGLSAAGLVAEYEKFRDPSKRFDDLIEWYGNRLRDTHDLLHILTGYGRDALGEQCVLAFTYSQNGNFGNFFIAYAGGWELKRQFGSRAPIFAAIREGQRNGRKAPRITEQNIMSLLAEPLEDARRRLNIAPPTQYLRAHEVFRSEGMDPYNLLASAAA